MIALKSLQPLESPSTFAIHLDLRGENLRSAIEEGEYDCIDEMITSRMNRSGMVRPNRQTVRLDLIGFNFDLKLGNVDRRIKSLGYRPASVIEFAQFGAQHPKIQLVYQIICWSGFDRFGNNAHHTLTLDSASLPGKRLRILGVHDILEGIPARSRIPCVKVTRRPPS